MPDKPWSRAKTFLCVICTPGIYNASLYNVNDETDDDHCTPVLYKLLKIWYETKVTIITD